MKPLIAKTEGILAPSILAADFAKLREEIQSVEKAGVDWIHVDVMDGHFVPNLTLGPPIVKSLKPITKLPLDCHLMVSDPEKWIEPFVQSGANIITIHVEAAGTKLGSLLKKIKTLGCYAGVTLNPATSLSEIEAVLDDVDLVLVMSVNPGFTGQKYIESSTEKVRELAQLRKDRSFLIEVDGGVGTQNIRALREAGADAFVAGAAIFYSADRNASVSELRKKMAGL